MVHAPATVSFRLGSLIVVGMLLLGITAGTVAVSFQRTQTRRCLDFYGVEAAWRVAKAPRVEVWTLGPTGRTGRLVAVSRHDVTDAKGIVHLRRGLVEDAGFRWNANGSLARLPDGAWDYALVFSDPAAEGRTIVVVDLDAEGGWLAVQGRPGRAGLGRLGRGLSEWIEATIPPDKATEAR